jgi:hypothetical protein
VVIVHRSKGGHPTNVLPLSGTIAPIAKRLYIIQSIAPGFSEILAQAFSLGVIRCPYIIGYRLLSSVWVFYHFGSPHHFEAKSMNREMGLPGNLWATSFPFYFESDSESCSDFNLPSDFARSSPSSIRIAAIWEADRRSKKANRSRFDLTSS